MVDVFIAGAISGVLNFLFGFVTCGLLASRGDDRDDSRDDSRDDD